jgi:DNA-binding NarL/FixJ family response regulator
MLADPIQVLVIDDHLAVRRGLELMLGEAGLVIAGVCGAEEATELRRRGPSDVILLELHLRQGDASGLARALLDERPPAPLVLTTACLEPASALIAAAQLGAPGFVLKSSPPEMFVQALTTVAGGGRFVDPEVAGLVAAEGEPSRLALLTPREREILGLLAEGCSGPEIAGRLFLSIETVRTHVGNAVTKLGARTRVEAVALLVRGEG